MHNIWFRAKTIHTLLTLSTIPFFLNGCLSRSAPPPPKEAATTPQPARNDQPEWLSDRYPDQKAPPEKPQAQSCPTPESAIRMAMGQILQRYGREALNRQLPLEAEIDERGVWTVRGTLPPQSRGRVNSVRVDSRNAKILSVK